MMTGWFEPRYGRSPAYTGGMQGRTTTHFRRSLIKKWGGITNVHWIYVSFMERVHMTIGQKAIGEKGKKDELWERQELIT